MLTLKQEIQNMPKIAMLRHKKRIALIAHDNKKEDMLEWAKYNVGTLRQHELYATGTSRQNH